MIVRYFQYGARLSGPFFVCVLAAVLSAGITLICGLNGTQLKAQSLSLEPPSLEKASHRRVPKVRAGSHTLAITSWNLQDALASGAIKRRSHKRAVWRHTFVPHQRKFQGSTQLDKTLHNADIVMLQGVNSIREARKLFPARRWKLIVSRAILKVARGRGPFPRMMPEGFATTAIAVRYQLGVRVTGQEHLLELAKADEEENGDTDGPTGSLAVSPTPSSGNLARDAKAANGSRQEPSPLPGLPAQAGLAVRVLTNGQMIWFVSAALGEPCEKDAKCKSRKILHDWIEDKRDYDIPVITGGRIYPQKTKVQRPLISTIRNMKILSLKKHAPRESEPKKTISKDKPGNTKPETREDAARSSCKNQDIVLDKKLKGTPTHVAKAGCIALVVLER